MSYSLDALAVAVQRGAGVPVLVEGGRDDDDAWILGDIWFPEDAFTVRFIRSGSWAQVVTAVPELRALRAGTQRTDIFGLIDRDCTDEAQLDALEPQGIYRWRRYCIESYLLDPGCWYEVFRFLMRPHGGLPESWGSPAAVQQQIHDGFTRCSPSAAFNRVVARTTAAHPEYAGAPRFARDPQPTRETQLAAELRRWASASGHPVDLGEEFEAELARLSQAAPEARLGLLDGKLVLNHFIQSFQAIKPGPNRPAREYLNEYLRECPSPPGDAVDILKRILALAAQAAP